MSQIVIALVLALALFATMAVTGATPAAAADDVVMLTADDFKYGTFVIDKPGTYKLAEDISFNPNSPATLNAAIQSGELPVGLAQAMGMSVPVDAYSAGFPLFTQFLPGGSPDFAPGGPLDAAYDPAAYGVGFFAAIAISADDVVLDLNGYTIEQSAEHALLQRFFAVIETADQPFIPNQGPADFGAGIDAAESLVIKNGTIGRSAHHGIHGNANVDVTISNVEFVDYEVAAVALNGVQGLLIENVNATNRKDVPVLGTFSSAQFIKQYINELAHNGSTTTLEVDGRVLTVGDIQRSLREAINNVHNDVIVHSAQIHARRHPSEFALFHNDTGLVDGNSYSFVINPLGVAVNGFPLKPDGVGKFASTDVMLKNVHVTDQHGAITEVPALDMGGAAAIDPVGAVFQVFNTDPNTGAPVTVSTLDPAVATYKGNVVANAQAMVAKAKANGEFAASMLDVTRANISADVLAWVEGVAGSETLTDIGATYLCNGDSMFHVNKGAIGFKMDGGVGVIVKDSGIDGLMNVGDMGSTLCGDYLNGKSHPAATLEGYGGSTVRGFTFAGTDNGLARRTYATGLEASYGSVVGYDVMTDSSNIRLIDTTTESLYAGIGGGVVAPTADPHSVGYYVGADTSTVKIVRGCAATLVAGITTTVDDRSGTAKVIGFCS